MRRFESSRPSHTPPSHDRVFSDSVVAGKVLILPRVSASANALVPTRDAKPRVWGANGRRVSQGRFRVVGCGAFRLGFDGGLGGEAENMSLFAPVVRQVLAQSQESRRRELDRLTALKERAHNIGRQIGQSNAGG